jgi:AcrR family transcriptional regulator
MRAPRSHPHRPLPIKVGTARSTEDRLIDAAGRIFARDGLEAATTRDIARDAGLNEVTLFRHFGTKEGVLAAVVRRTFGPGERAERMPDTGDLRADLSEFARQYERALRRNLALVRTCVGEIHRHRDYAARVLQAIFQPLRADLIARLEKARAERSILLSTEPEIAADLLSGMILSGVLRDTAKLKRRGYTALRYRAACVDVLWTAVAGPGARPA